MYDTNPTIRQELARIRHADLLREARQRQLAARVENPGRGEGHSRMRSLVLVAALVALVGALTLVGASRADARVYVANVNAGRAVAFDGSPNAVALRESRPNVAFRLTRAHRLAVAAVANRAARVAMSIRPVKAA